MRMLAGRKILVTGLLSNRSIAYGIAAAARREGAELAFTCVGERFRERVVELAADFRSTIVLPCDVTSDEQIDALPAGLRAHWDGLDGLVHAIAFAPRESIAGGLLDGFSRDAFRQAHEVSAYSFPALAKALLPLMEGRPAALLTLSYLGAERAIPHYNTMGLAKASLEASVRYLATHLGPKGIRVNAISAGPIKTLAAAGISGFTNLQACRDIFATAAQRYDRRCRQCRRLPAVGSGRGHHGRDRARRRRFQRHLGDHRGRIAPVPAPEA